MSLKICLKRVLTCHLSVIYIIYPVIRKTPKVVKISLIEYHLKLLPGNKLASNKTIYCKSNIKAKYNSVKEYSQSKE